MYPLWLLITPMAWRTAFLLSLPKTAGWLIHSKLASNSASRAATVLGSIPVEDPTESASFDRWRDIPPLDWTREGVAELGGEGVRRRSGVAVEVGDDASVADDGLGDFWFGGGIGGRPPLPRPFSIERVSFNKCCARSC